MQDDAELYRSELVEKICELDDDLMMAYQMCIRDRAIRVPNWPTPDVTGGLRNVSSFLSATGRLWRIL